MPPRLFEFFWKLIDSTGQEQCKRPLGKLSPDSPDELELGAQMLLIHAHGPAYNSHYIMQQTNETQEAQNVRILNWGADRGIEPEIADQFLG